MEALSTRHKRIASAAVGGLLLVGLAAVSVQGTWTLARWIAIGLAVATGVAMVVAGTDTVLTERWAWYQWSGLAYACVGLQFPVDAVFDTASALELLVLAGLFGLTVLRSVDLIVYHGESPF